MAGHVDHVVDRPVCGVNHVGVDLIREQMGVAAYNAISNPAELGDFLIDRLGLGA